MDKSNSISLFLKLIAEISKNDIEIDSNLVYSNLVTFNSNKEDITYYHDMWLNNFEKIRNLNITKEKAYIKFQSFNFNNSDNKIKVYIPLDKKHIYKGVCLLIKYLSENNIIHSTKVFNYIRNDNIIVTVDDLFSAEKIRKFVSTNEYIKSNSNIQNIFMFNDNNLSFVWDGYLTYNVVVSEWISEYINELKSLSKLDCVDSNNFLDYLNKEYKSIFEEGNNINEFIEKRNFVNIPVEFLNYKYITEIIINSMKENALLKDFSSIIKNINLNETKEIKTLIYKDKNKVDITLEQKEIFDFVYVELTKKNGEENAVKLFKQFINNLDYRIFTRKNNIRNMLIENNITPSIIKNIINDEMKNALINASIQTTKKYDVVQLGRALFGIKNNDYSAFTNENNVRNNLRLMVSKDEINDVLNSILENENKTDDNYWIFIELINSKLSDK